MLYQNNFQNNGEFNFLAISFFIAAVIPLFTFNKRIDLSEKLKTLSIAKIEFLLILSIAITAITLLLIGVPLFSGDVNLNKTKVSSYPVLVRFFRLGIPFCLIHLTLLNKIKLFPKKKLSRYFLLSFLLSPLFGFKGYIVYILFPYLFHLTIQKKFNLKNYLKLSFIGIGLIFLVSFIEKIKIWEVLQYVMIRLTYNNLLGNNLAIENPKIIEGIFPIISEIQAILNRLSGEREIQLLQTILYKYNMNGNPYNMQVSVSSIVEYFSTLESTGILIFFVIYFITIKFLKNKIYSNSLTGITLGLLGLITFYEAILNGLMIFKLIDFIGSMVIIYISSKIPFEIFKFHTNK